MVASMRILIFLTLMIFVGPFKMNSKNNCIKPEHASFMALLRFQAFNFSCVGHLEPLKQGHKGPREGYQKHAMHEGPREIKFWISVLFSLSATCIVTGRISERCVLEM